MKRYTRMEMELYTSMNTDLTKIKIILKRFGEQGQNEGHVNDLNASL